MNKKGGIIASLLGDVALLLIGFVCGSIFGDKIIEIVRGTLHI
jgi:hypothetical protein